MSRELKFRAWDGKTIRYDVTGFEHGVKNEMVGIFLDGDYYTLKDNEHHPQAVVMLYTGLKDRNGKEIYEGDIVTVDGIVYKVDWQGAGDWFVDIEDDSCFMFTPEVYKLEVIGNIYENSELLSVKI